VGAQALRTAKSFLDSGKQNIPNLFGRQQENGRFYRSAEIRYK
jgi:hypothetical protein